MSVVRRLGLLAPVLVLVVAAFVVAGCGGSDDKSSSADTQTQAAEPAPPADTTSTAAETPAADAPPATKLDLNLPPKTIGIYCAVCQGETVRRSAEATKKAVELVGWKAQMVDGGGIPEKQQQAMTALINNKVDAIIGAFLEPGPIATALEAAKKANIPVLSVGFPSTPSDLVAAVYPGESDETSRLLVERMAEELPKGAKVAVVDLPQYYGVGLRKKVWEATAKEKGFETVATHDIGDLSKQIVESEKAGLDILNSQPKLDAFWSCCDFSGQPVARAIQASGRDNVKVYSYYALPSVLKDIRAGNLVAVEIDNVKASFMAVEQLARFFKDGTPVNDDEAIQQDPPKGVIADETNAPADGEEMFPFDQLWAPYAERLTKAYAKGA